MDNQQFEHLSADIAALRHAFIALALASPQPENVVAELDRQKELSATALVPSQASDRYIELVQQKIQDLREVIASQL